MQSAKFSAYTRHYWGFRRFAYAKFQLKKQQAAPGWSGLSKTGQSFS